MGYLLKRSQLTALLHAFSRHGRIVAPLTRTSDGVVTFQDASVADLNRLDLSTNPPFPAKKFLMPATEDLFDYDMETQQLTDRKAKGTQTILFGLRLCDLNAVRIQDALFLGAQYYDDHYKARRESLVLVGWYCNVPPHDTCFCESMGLTHSYDILLRELPEREGMIYIDVGTPKGAFLLQRVQRRMALPEHNEAIPPIRTAKHLATTDIRKHFDNPAWQRVTESQCLSCQRCTMLCPTCLCYDIYDVNKQDERTGTRQRTWDSCHGKEFTRVAGGHIFRPDRTARFKHRVYHKLVYYLESFGGPMCTGCGRCISQCPAKIDFVELINEIDREARR